MQTTTNARNRIPRVAVPSPSLSRRLHKLLRHLVLTHKLSRLGKKLDSIEQRLDRDATDAHALAQLFRYSPLIETRRRALRRELANVAKEYRAVRLEIDNLVVTL